MIYFGKITMTHGLTIYIANQPHQITNVRPHKNYYLITIDDQKDINNVELFRHQKVFLKEEDIHTEEIIVETLIHFSVYENQNLLGKVKSILYNKNGILLEIENQKKFYIPYQNNFVKEINKKEQKIFVENVDGILNSF